MPLSIIVPAHNAAATLEACLLAVREAAGAEAEIIVADDGSEDETRSIAARLGATVVQQRQQGPAAARNAGARVARGDVLVFVDSDVVVSNEAINALVNALESHPDVVASFGSYDAKPRVRGQVARYRNLLHAYTHQKGRREASTFWAGLGAVKREAFAAANGFDANRFERASIEDIEFGVRLRSAGGVVLLVPEAQGSHLKEWTLRTMVMTDLWCRAVPWTRLLRQTGRMPNDLNLRWHQRLSVAAVWAAPWTLLMGASDSRWLSAAGLLAALHMGLNAGFFGWIWRNAGLGAMLSAIPLHWIFHWVAGLGYLIGQTDGHSTPVAAPRGVGRS